MKLKRLKKKLKAKAIRSFACEEKMDSREKSSNPYSQKPMARDVNKGKKGGMV